MVIAAAARVSCSHGRLAAARVNKKGALSFLIKLLYDLSGNRTRVYAVRGRRLDRLTIRPYAVLFCLFAADLYMIARPDGFVKYFLKKVESFFE